LCSGECKNEFLSNSEEIVEEEIVEDEKKAVGILLDTTAYSGSSFEVSEDVEQEEEAAVANITISSIDTDVGVLDVSEGKVGNIQKSIPMR
jgi:hypothetical protein